MPPEVSGNGRTVLLTGAGGAATYALIEHLRSRGFRVIAADMDAQAVGLFAADKAYAIPPGSSPEFLQALRRIVADERVAAVVPLVDEELYASLALEEEGTAIVLLPRRPFVALCLDKWQLMQALAAHRLPHPATRLAGEGRGDLRYPLVIKPRTGRGSRGVKILQSERDLDAYLAEAAAPPDAFILQEYIDGPEYTVSVVVWRDGQVQAVVPKEVICKRGITRLAVTRANDAIDTLCREVQRALRADGPFNVQLRMDPAGTHVYPFEINPRFSTTISLTMAAGIDELGGLLVQALDGKAAHPFGTWKEGLVLVRRTLDGFVSEAQFRSHPVHRAGEG